MINIIISCTLLIFIIYDIIIPVQYSLQSGRTVEQFSLVYGYSAVL